MRRFEREEDLADLPTERRERRRIGERDEDLEGARLFRRWAFLRVVAEAAEREEQRRHERVLRRRNARNRERTDRGGVPRTRGEPGSRAGGKDDERRIEGAAGEGAIT